ncbi:hypothetical protein M0R72_11485 [Candidatus Pacearchaeota archaeon]|jgi:hypothetical protein|nr:hypothetical protein [Candidatus Pacearchaeota archaeon]
MAIKILYPSSDIVKQLIPSTGTTHYTLVRDDSDATYNYLDPSASAWREDRYGVDSYSGGEINSVTLYAKATEDRVDLVQLIVLLNGWSGIGFTQNNPNGTYNSGARTTNPDTGSPWGWGDFSYIIAGFNVYSSEIGKYAKLIKVWLSVDYDAAPMVSTQAVTDILTDSPAATFNGTITFVGDLTCTKRGFCWNKTGNPTVADDHWEETGDFPIGAFEYDASGLEYGTLYYVRAYAYNSEGYGYGDQVTFTTEGQVVKPSSITAGSSIGTPTLSDTYTWNSPPTWSPKEIVDHDQLNTYLRDNSIYLKYHTDKIGSCKMKPLSTRQFSLTDILGDTYYQGPYIYRNFSLKPRVVLVCIEAVLGPTGECIKKVMFKSGAVTAVTKGSQSCDWLHPDTTMHSNIFGIVPPGWYYEVAYFDNFMVGGETSDVLKYWFEFDIG